jgi:ABC-2 type transport system permease protein
MFWELFRFELYYRRRRVTTYVYFLVIFITSFITITSPTLNIAGTSDATTANSPYIIAVLMVVLSFFFTLITSSFVGVAVIRDVEHEMAPIIFTTSIHKGSYLFGRFAGSLVVLILLNTGIILGALMAYVFGRVLPWDITWHSKEILPFNLFAYLQPFLLFSVSNIFITGALFFAAGALVRKPVVIYSQGIALLMLYQIANIFYLRDLDSQYIAALLDPFAVQTFVYMTHYWTPAEQNTLLVPFEGALLYNRLIWTSIAVVVLIITYWRFSFTSRRGFTRKKKAELEEEVEARPVIGPIPEVVRTKGVLSELKQLVSATWFHFSGIWTEVPFIAIAGTGLLVLIVNSINMDNMYGTSSYPTTSAVLTMLGSFGLFFYILVIFYSGEIAWKERQHKIQSIIDSTPVSNHIVILSKFLCLCLVYLLFLFGFFLYGILLQSFHGYYQYELTAYFGTLSETFINLCLITSVALLIQVLSKDKFLGFVITVMVVILVALLPLFGIENEMFAYSSGSLGAFSQMNGFGHFVIPFVWLKGYWLALAIVFFVITVSRTGTRQLAPFLKFTGLFAILAFIGIGAFIYYNTAVINRFQNTRHVKTALVRYEKELKHTESVLQPKIVAVDLNIDLYPDRRSFLAKGFYYLKNFDSLPVKEIQIQHMISPQINVHDLSFGRTATVIEEHPDLGYRSFAITPALAPGDSLRMDFVVEFTQKGFKSKPQNTDLVYNGTFFRNNYFPTVGYNSHQELTGGDDRRRFALNPRDDFSNRASRSSVNVFGKEADRIRFKAIVSTDSTQFAIAPGQLIKEWHQNGRHYQQYESGKTIPDFYAILSGRYELKKDKWNDTDLEIYYHPAHKFNIDRMMQGLKDGLDYYTKNFGSTPESPVRIVEFPRYSTLAQSFPGTIAFSEGVGFILKVSDPAKDLDVPYYVTAHELAHQWWGQHVIEADAPGRAMLSEGMAQYSALMVMRRTFPPEVMQLFLKYELDAYLKGRTSEKLKEMPLMTGDEPYISYNKSALVFFALQDYIGEDSINAAFKKFHEKWAFKGPPYPTSEDLVDEIRKVTPDSISYLLTDLFEHITFYENKATEAAYTILSETHYEVTVNLTSQKLQVDSKGIEVPIAINDWIDIGVYSNDQNGKPKLVYLKKHKFTREKSTLTISLRERPVKVGIDPLHKLIDHHSNDNVIDVGTVVELATSPLGN